MTDPSALRQARLAGGFTHRQVAEVARLDRTSIAHYERGHGRPSPAATERWREALRQLLTDRHATLQTALSLL